MSLSNATITPTNIPLSPMRVTWNGVDLGGTVDGCNLSIKYETADIMVDQWGKTVADKKVSGHAYSVKMTLAEIKNKDLFKVAFPSSNEISSGGNHMIYADMQIGDSLLAKAKVLTLHPLEASDADLSEDYMFYKAIPTEVSEVKYGPDKQSGLSIEFIVFPDTTTVPARFFIYGDPTIGIVNASAGSAVAATGNTGNGTIDTITVANAYTKTETITALVIGTGAASSNVFKVSGSQSGILGTATLAAAGASTVNFVSNPINFKITQGGTQFVTGDSFTIATTASNYS